MRLLSRSIFILLALYGLVFAVGSVFLVKAGVPPWGAILFCVIFVGLKYLIGPWMIQWLLDISWDDQGEQLPARNREFIEKLCRERGLKVPRIGIIHSATPNAFAFGHVPGNARIVVTTGLLEVLTPEEANAVLAHELGHVEHWDFVVMTVAALAPLVLYQVYVFTRGIDNNRVIAYSAYLCYWMSEFVVLLLNRTREYFADHYSAEVTGSPDMLSSALMKIAYGFVKAEAGYKEAMRDEARRAEARRARRIAGSVAVMGISNVRAGSAFLLSGTDSTAAAAVMRWDLVNPWARLYELGSTHPLTAFRIQALNQQTAAMHQEVRYPLPEDRRTRWGTFPIEVVIWALPWLSAISFYILFLSDSTTLFGGLQVATVKPLLVIVFGVSWILRISYRYRGRVEDASVGELLEDVEVSEMRPRAVRLKGKIVGRGEPGAFWSSDLVLRDPTGIIFMLYRPSLPLARFFFAVYEAEDYIGREVELEGWYRRGVSPYVEMSRLTTQEGSSHSTYSRWIQYLIAVCLVIAGAIWLP